MIAAELREMCLEEAQSISKKKKKTIRQVSADFHAYFRHLEPLDFGVTEHGLLFCDEVCTFFANTIFAFEYSFACLVCNLRC